MYRITKGLSVPIAGEPDQTVVEGPAVTRVAVVGDDYIGMKPTMLVNVDDVVKLGQPLFTDKKTEGVTFTAPAAGKVVEINRGARRAFQSLVIEVSGDDAETFEALGQQDLETVSREAVTDVLVKSGLWTTLRTRPFSRVPQIGSVPSSIFVQAIDTNPLAVDPAPVIAARERDFQIGLLGLARLTDGDVNVCRSPAKPLAGEDHNQIKPREFEGPHPAGLPGTHINRVEPCGPNKVVWTINYQDVLAMGHLLATGQICTERIVSIAGPAITTPKIIRTRIGASIEELLDGGLTTDNSRVVSGSILSGRKAEGPFGYLGRYHLQVSALVEGNQRDFLGWVSPGNDKFSIRRVFTSAFDSARRFAFDTSTNGSKRAMVPIGMYEQVMPLDVIATPLLKALITGDTEQAQALGCLELDEEDLALCTYVCPGKYEYGPILRECLTQIEKEG